MKGHSPFKRELIIKCKNKGGFIKENLLKNHYVRKNQIIGDSGEQWAHGGLANFHLNTE
jgi:hypothetical protein